MSDTDRTWVALLRGVNVGGGNKVPMVDLRALAESLGWGNVRSYIASGNLVFEAGIGDHEGDLRAALKGRMAVDVPVLVLSGQEVLSALEDCPFKAEGKAVHAMFCWEEPMVDAALCARLRAPEEALQVVARRAYLLAPNGIGRSKLMEKMEGVLGVPFTARNLNTLTKLAALVRAG